MTGAHPDLLFQRYFEGAVSPYEEQLLSKVLVRGGALVDRFVELRELECALAEYFGGSGPAPTGAREAVPGKAGSGLPGFSGACTLLSDPFRARRFPAGRGPSLEEDCLGEILKSYLRRVRRVEPASHRQAVALSMGLLSGEPRDVLRCRHRRGMSSRDIAEQFSRPLGEMEELVLWVQKFLAGCVRMRLARTG